MPCLAMSLLACTTFPVLACSQSFTVESSRTVNCRSKQHKRSNSTARQKYRTMYCMTLLRLRWIFSHIPIQCSRIYPPNPPTNTTSFFSSFSNFFSLSPTDRHHHFSCTHAHQFFSLILLDWLTAVWFGCRSSCIAWLVVVRIASLLLLSTSRQL